MIATSWSSAPGPLASPQPSPPAETGARVILVDDNPLPGGQIWRAALAESKQNVWQNAEAVSWLQRLRNCGAEQLYATRVVALLSPGRVLAENEENAVEISFRRVILATGARELLLPFPGWTLPNLFAPGGLQALVKSGFSVQEKRVVLAGTGPLLFAVASFLKSKGAHIEGVFDQAPLVSHGAICSFSCPAPHFNCRRSHSTALRSLVHLFTADGVAGLSAAGTGLRTVSHHDRCSERAREPSRATCSPADFTSSRIPNCKRPSVARL